MCLRRSSLFDIKYSNTNWIQGHCRQWPAYPFLLRKKSLSISGCVIQTFRNQRFTIVNTDVFRHSVHFCISYNLLVFWRTIYLSNKKAQCTYYNWGLSLPLQSLQALRLQRKVTVMKLHSNTTICIRFLYNSSSNPSPVLTGQRTPTWSPRTCMSIVSVGVSTNC